MDVQELLMTAGRGVLVYVVFLVIIRLLGKRTVGNFTPFDFLVALMLGEVVDEIIYGDVNLVQGFTAVIVIALLHFLNSFFSFKSPAFDKLVEGRPVPLLTDGQLDDAGRRQERIDHNELEGMLRRFGQVDPAKAPQAIEQVQIEPSGQLSVKRRPQRQPAQKADKDRLPGGGS